MRTLRIIFSRMLLAGSIVLVAIVATGFYADPTDDFSFAIDRLPVNGAGYNLMSEKEVRESLSVQASNLTNRQLDAISSHILSLCLKYRFDPAFVLSLIEVESRYRPAVISPAGAIGLMQIMPATAQLVAKAYDIPYAGPKSLTDPITNISIGMAYLTYLREKYGELSPYFHIAAYNIGPAKLDELRAKKHFRPTQTKKYYQSIRENTPRMRFHRIGKDRAIRAVRKNHQHGVKKIDKVGFNPKYI